MPMLFFYVIVIIVSVWVAKDAKKHGLAGGVLWGIGIFLLPIFIFPVWLAFRLLNLFKQKGNA